MRAVAGRRRVRWWAVVGALVVFGLLLWCAHLGAVRQDAWCRSQPPATAATADCLDSGGGR